MYLVICLSCTFLHQQEPHHTSPTKESVFSEAIEPKIFKDAWKEDTLSRLVAYDSISFKELPISERSKAFLCQAGLPNTCAPFLSFNEKLYAETLRSLKEALALQNDDFIHHYVIGSGEEGIICIDTRDDDKIKIIDMAYAYRVDSRNTSAVHTDYVPQRFMNSSVGHLAHCLLIYRQFVSQVRVARNHQSFEKIEPTVQELEDLRKALLKADPNCLSEKSFWVIETASNSYMNIRGPGGVKFH